MIKRLWIVLLLALILPPVVAGATGGSSSVQVSRSARIGQPINGSTSGSIPYIDSLGQVAQDNDNLSYDDDNDTLQVKNISSAKGSASDLTISCGDNSTIVLTETVYEDLPIFLSAARVPAANAPAWETFVGNLNGYAYEVNDFQEFTAETLHGYDVGSDLEFHIHGALNATLAGGDETVKFEVEYSIADMDGTDGIGDVFPATTTINAEFIVPNGTADLTQIYIPIGSDSTGAFDIGATVQGRIRRIASSGTELVGDIFLTQVSIHYLSDTIGSREITGK